MNILEDMDTFSKQDPYLKMCITNNKDKMSKEGAKGFFKTKYHAKAGKHAKWTDVFANKKYSGEEFLRIEAYDDDGKLDNFDIQSNLIY